MKQRGARAHALGATSPHYEAIEMPRNSPTGFVCAFFATVMGFALIWHIWWMVDRRPASAPTPPSWCSPGATCRGRRSRPRRSPRIDRANRRPARAALRPQRRAPVTARRQRRPLRPLSARPRGGSDPARRPRRRRPGLQADRSSATASGSSCSATSSCSRPSSPPTRCWPGTPPAGRAGDSCSICTTWRSRPAACCSRASPAAWRASRPARATGSVFYAAMAVTFVLGAAFLGAGGQEFAGLIARGRRAAAQRLPVAPSSPWSAATALHVSVGLLWLLTMMAQVFAKGFRPDILRRILCFSLFWHALDIIWVAIFTVVYLLGVDRMSRDRHRRTSRLRRPRARRRTARRRRRRAQASSAISSGWRWRPR